MKFGFISIRSAYDDADAVDELYRLLLERPAIANISHLQNTRAVHAEFIRNEPYRFWFIIRGAKQPRALGAMYVTRRNEIGISITTRFQRSGLATYALNWLLRTVKPLPAIPGQRLGYWLANINPNNQVSIALFKKLGFTLLQHTYALRRDDHAKAPKRPARRSKTRKGTRAQSSTTTFGRARIKAPR